MNSGLPDLYAVLQVDRTASREEIRRAYRRLLRSLHPDLQSSDAGAGPAGAGSVEAARRLRALLEAYAVLGGPERRAEYDRATEPRPSPSRDPDPLLLNWPPRQARDTVWMFPPRSSPLLDAQELLEYFLRRGFPW
ncbi:J domain-containing protein [Arthrobacter deserti]|uniref:J domain-containing protein n=1 Tax=Arthrobacter deserti TaxID=1742687 RepID=A0ABX1JU42_9MICC|nr:J domain-containing protein [Arthrobacter deserti]